MFFLGYLNRYSDFIVNEVDTEGNVVHLTTLEAPAEVDKILFLFVLNAS